MNLGDSGGIWAVEGVEMLKDVDLVRMVHVCARRQYGEWMSRGGIMKSKRYNYRPTASHQPSHSNDMNPFDIGGFSEW